MIQITDVTHFSRVFSTSIPFGDYGGRVNTDLGITNKNTIENAMPNALQSQYAAFYSVANQVGAYGGYIFDETIDIERVELYIQRYGNGSVVYEITLQKYVNNEWVDVTVFEAPSNLPFPVNIFAHDLLGPVDGVRFIHKSPVSPPNNTFIFFGMILYKREPKGFIVNLYRNNSENNRLEKDLTLLADYRGILKQETSIIDPIILLNESVEAIANANYLYIEKFNRYYYINDIVSIRSGLCEIHCHVDVLMSFKSEIVQAQVICKRQEGLWNLYLDDGSFQVFADRIVLTKAFPSGFTTQNYVLAVAGS